MDQGVQVNKGIAITLNYIAAIMILLPICFLFIWIIIDAGLTIDSRAAIAASVLFLPGIGFFQRWICLPLRLENNTLVFLHIFIKRRIKIQNIKKVLSIPTIAWTRRARIVIVMPRFLFPFNVFFFATNDLNDLDGNLKRAMSTYNA